jgi:hypothetical protein
MTRIKQTVRLSVLRRVRQSPALIVAVVALVVAAGGVASATFTEA